MPVKTVEFPIPIGVRLTDAQAAKLERLATLTSRPRGAVIRLLIDRAQFAGTPDIQMTLLKELGDLEGADREFVRADETDKVRVAG
jgi:hypothetical protein